MIDDNKRKAWLADTYRLEIRRTSALIKSALADYAYHLAAHVVDAEISRMRERIKDKTITDADLPFLRDLVLADLWPRLREQHKALRSSAYDHLRVLNPDTIGASAKFTCDIGWRGLIQAACNRIETYPSSWKVKMSGAKEKLGALVLFIDCDYSARGCRSEVERLLEEIRLRSLATCEICGRQGRLRIGSYAKALCNEHAVIMNSFRDDDGMCADPWHWQCRK